MAKTITAGTIIAIGLIVLMAAPARGQEGPPVRTVEAVDLDRYLGDWFEIARFRNRFQGQCAGEVRASYARRSDGLTDVVNRCRTAEGEINDGVNHGARRNR